MTAEERKIFLESVRAALGDAKADVSFVGGEAVLRVLPGKARQALQVLRDTETLAFTQLMDVCGVDYPERAARFDVVYHLLSPANNERLRVIVAVGEGASVPTAVPVYPSAGWFEREVYDLFGVVFEDHPDMRRILTDYGFEGHPLRRDFPLLGFTQVRYDELARAVVYEPVSLQQDYRAFDASGPWRGLTDVQKREGKA